MNIQSINYNLLNPKYNSVRNFSKSSSLKFSSKMNIEGMLIDKWKKEDSKFAFRYDNAMFYNYTYGLSDYYAPDLSQLKKIVNLYKNNQEKLKQLLLKRGEGEYLWSGSNDIFYNGEVYFDIKKFLFNTAEKLSDKSVLKEAILNPNIINDETLFAYDYNYCKYSIPLALQLVKRNKNSFSNREIEKILSDINNNKTLSKEFKNKAKSYLI